VKPKGLLPFSFHFSLFWPKWIQSIPFCHSPSFCKIYSVLCKWSLLFSIFQWNLLFFSMCSTCPRYQILDEEYEIWLFSFCNFLQLHFTSSLSSLHTLCSTPISDTFDLSSSFSMRSYIWHQHQTTGKVLVFVYSETCLWWNFFLL
jgi:hypothetical protein